MTDPYIRPATPQALVHRLPDKDEAAFIPTQKPSRFIILISASTAVVGKVQVAQAVSAALGCPLFQANSLHESAAKAALVGADASAPNEARYQRMWLSKMTRTGLLFPEESRAAGAGFSGFGGTSSTSTSRRGSFNSNASECSGSETESLASSVAETPAQRYVKKLPSTLPSQTAQGRANSALMVLTHPILESWQKNCIRNSVGEYIIGVLFVPLDVASNGNQDLPILRPLDPNSMTSSGRITTFQRTRDWSDEIVIGVDTDANVDDLAEDVIRAVRRVLEE